MAPTGRIAWQNFGDELRHLRMCNGLTQQELATLLGYDRVHLCRLEAGQRRPSRRFLHALAAMVRVSPADERMLHAFERMLEYKLEDMEIE